MQQVRQEMREELRQRVREAVADRPREWLLEQLLDLALTPGLPAQREERPPGGRETQWSEPEEERQARMERLRARSVDLGLLRQYVGRYRRLTRQALIEDGLLVAPPAKGSPGLIGPEHRTEAGEELLREAKDLLYALLFGDEEAGVTLHRVERELLTLTVPRGKAHAISFVLRAATEIGAQGTWRDPRGAAHDDRAPNTVFQVEYGEVAEELVGNGITACLRLINDLEVNEQVLYGRMENVEESTLA
ncbi:hypothetical protein V1L54_11505 [Streptomyces sp. TRM 70361]|uniref:hypothetical protein n=1 Tax=Streptomyces sp. TRM 70361 TaxID=3116553 RepID=UPI002E7BC1B6|nr:hypothetical protein [Streptomyces sp. TRM 70361]MEE1940015.1 hypothetical protein [Streptomyces sp. TRM 70361]